MNTFFDKVGAARMGKLLLFLVLMLALFVTMLFIGEVRTFQSPADIANAATIDVTGTGNTFAIPDIATESFTVQDTEATVADAQTKVTTDANAAIAFLTSSGVDQKDIQTTDYSANPQYSYPAPCVTQLCTTAVQNPPTITGYTVSETVTVKIRDTSKVGTIIDGLGQQGVTGLSGPNFTIDDMDTVNATARAAAIKDAQTKAQALAKQLGVRLVRVVGFSENGGTTGPSPMLYAAKAMDAGSAAAPSPVISAGQNEYTSNITVTYEIR